MTALRIGLLECDHVDERLMPVTGGDYLDLFRSWLAPRADDVELVAYDAVGGRLPAEPGECDGWLCTGSRDSVYDDKAWIHDLRDVVAGIHAAQVPFVGVCFGHQMLAHALGGRVDRAPGGWGVGVHRIDVVAEHPWLRPEVDEVRLHFMHQDQVLDLPPGATLVGSSAHCPNAMFALDTSFGMQPHPEFTPAYTETLLQLRVLRIGEETTAAALASLRERTDEPTVADWAMRVWRG